MNITRKNIIETSTIINVNWLRKNTPYTEDNKSIHVDSVEFEINHKGIEKLERNIESSNEFIMCFVHFKAGTNMCKGIYFSVWNTENSSDDSIVLKLSKEERKVLVGYALEKLNEGR